MIVRVSPIRPKIRGAELRIGLDKILSESIITEHGALNGARNKGQTLITREGGVVVENVQTIGQGRVVSVSEIVPDVLLSSGTEMHCTGLAHRVHSCSYRSKAGSGNVDAVEHLIQQRRFSAAARRVERFLQPIGEKVRCVEV